MISSAEHVFVYWFAVEDGASGTPVSGKDRGRDTHMLISTNLGQLVEASGAADTVFFVSIFSVGNCLGRAFVGLCSDSLVRRGVPRSIMLLLVSTIFTAMGLIGTRTSSVWLVSVVVALGSLGMGAINGLEPAIVSEMFGLKNMGKNCKSPSNPHHSEISPQIQL